MYQQFSFMLAVLLVVIAGVTVLIMLEMNSSQQEPRSKSGSGCPFFQRVLGYLFLVLFAVLLACMVFRAGSLQEDMPAPVIILALLLVPLIMIKVVIARQQAQISTKLILLGTAIFGLSFGLTGMAAKYYAQNGDRLKSSLLLSDAEQNTVSMEPGQAIMSKKCSKCHSLERIYTASMTDWSPIVSRMANFDAPNISSTEVKHIAEYLNQLEEKKRQQLLDDKIKRGRKLISAKCSTCHSLDKIFIAEMNAQRWRETVDDMIKIVGEPSYMNDEEKEIIISFLSSRRQGRRELWADAESNGALSPQLDGVRKLISRKCSAGCHALERVLRSEKSREAWTETVNSMVEMTGDPEYLSEPEKRQIIDFLSLPLDKRGGGATAPPPSAGLEHPLLKAKCQRCHSLQIVEQAEKSTDEWAQTVNKMAENSGDPNYLSEQEKQDIITIISSWEVMK
ncbi:MAG: hypothetical protein ACTFAL_06010 [Candidatus Electronema sp. V4]|uniref:hypothetical protein n=1 Tax=Candidatus Electronema sp. V4 TaxID=3454756 RepID=UPI004055500C